MKKGFALIFCLMLGVAFATENSQSATVSKEVKKEAPLLIVNQKPSACPFCLEKTIATILWGKPHMTPALEKKIASGEVILGGCVIPENAPTWKCAHCGATFFESKGAKLPPTQKEKLVSEIEQNIKTYQKNPKTEVK